MHPDRTREIHAQLSSLVKAAEKIPSNMPIPKNTRLETTMTRTGLVVVRDRAIVQIHTQLPFEDPKKRRSTLSFSAGRRNLDPNLDAMISTQIHKTPTLNVKYSGADAESAARDEIPSDFFPTETTGILTNFQLSYKFPAEQPFKFWVAEVRGDYLRPELLKVQKDSPTATASETNLPIEDYDAELIKSAIDSLKRDLLFA